MIPPAQKMASARRLHHVAFRVIPTLAMGEECDGQPFAQCRQLIRLAPVPPQGGTLREPELRSAAHRLSLLRRQPFPQSGNQEVMRQLIMKFATSNGASIDWRHELELGVQDAHKLIEVV